MIAPRPWLGISTRDWFINSDTGRSGVDRVLTLDLDCVDPLITLMIETRIGSATDDGGQGRVLPLPVIRDDVPEFVRLAITGLPQLQGWDPNAAWEQARKRGGGVAAAAGTPDRGGVLGRYADGPGTSMDGQGTDRRGACGLRGRRHGGGSCAGRAVRPAVPPRGLGTVDAA